MPSIAIVGASADRTKFGNKAVRAYVRQGWTVRPVHPRAQEIEGLPVFAAIEDVPTPIDRVTLYVPPAVGMTLLADIANVDPAELFLNPGTESPELIARAESLGLKTTVGCAIIDVGESPAAL